MKKNLDALILTLILSCCNTAWGAVVMPELKKANTEICIKMGRSAQGAPKNEAKMPAFCNCVTDTYWDSVPQAEYNLLTASGKSPSLEANMEKRLNLAKAICLKKAG